MEKGLIASYEAVIKSHKLALEHARRVGLKKIIIHRPHPYFLFIFLQKHLVHIINVCSVKFSFER